MTLREQIKALDAKATAELFHDDIRCDHCGRTRGNAKLNQSTHCARPFIKQPHSWTGAHPSHSETSSPSASADAANALADRVETSAAEDVARLVEQLSNEGGLNGGSGAYAWRARELCAKAAAALTTQARRNAELEAEHARLREALEWYASEARGAAEAMSPDKPKTQAMTAILTVLALDAGNRASAALKGGRDEA